MLLAIGGSTNAVLHLTAIAGRVGVDLDLGRLNEISDDDAGAGRSEADRPALHGGSVRRRRHRRGAARAEAAAPPRLPHGHRRDAGANGLPRRTVPVDRAVVKPLGEPLQPKGGLVALFGYLAPKGAIFKRSAADPKLFEREGRAVVFTSLEDLSAAHRRSRARCDAGRFPRVAERRTPQRLGHARGRLSADPGQARARRRQGHGAHLRRAHERHGLRHGRAARDARCGERRPARPGPQRRPHPPHRRASAASISWSHRRSWRAARSPRRQFPSAATPASTAATSCRPTTAAISTSCANTRSPRLKVEEAGVQSQSARHDLRNAADRHSRSLIPRATALVQSEALAAVLCFLQSRAGFWRDVL